MQNEDVKSEERASRAWLDASYCKEPYKSYAKRRCQGLEPTKEASLYNAVSH